MPDGLRGLRRAVLIASLCGSTSAALAGVLAWPLFVAAAVGTVLGAVLAASAPDDRARLLRALATVGVAALAMVMLPIAFSGRGAGAREVLGPLLVGVAALQTLTWRSRRDLQAGLLSALGLLVLGASYAPDILVGLPLIVGWVAALSACALAQRQRDTEGVDAAAAMPSGRPPVGPVVAATSLAAVLGLTAFLLVPVEAAGSASSPLAALAAGGNAPSGARATFGGGVFSSGRIDMRLRGDLTDRPVAEVPAASPGLWRGTVYDEYDGTAWRLNQRRAVRIPGPPYTVAKPVGGIRRDDVRVIARTDGTLFAPGEVTEVMARGGRRLAQDGLGNLKLLGTREYVVASEGPRADSADAQDPRWLQLPPSLPTRVESLARSITADVSTPTDSARAIETWLRANATYRTDSPVPDRGEDAVDRFLFVDKTGFCEQFAAAHAVLLRSLGIPTKFVGGLAYGIDAGQGRRTFREKDQHTWIEVWQPGVGWISFDPTAGTTLASGGVGASLRARLATFLDGALRRVDSVPGGRPAVAVGLLIATTAIGLLLPWRPRLRRRPVRAAAPTMVTTGRPALAAFLRFDDRLGAARRRPAESLAEMAGRLGPVPAPALSVVAEECYAAVPPADADSAADQLDALAHRP